MHLWECLAKAKAAALTSVLLPYLASALPALLGEAALVMEYVGDD